MAKGIFYGNMSDFRQQMQDRYNSSYPYDAAVNNAAKQRKQLAKQFNRGEIDRATYDGELAKINTEQYNTIKGNEAVAYEDTAKAKADYANKVTKKEQVKAGFNKANTAIQNGIDKALGINRGAEAEPTNVKDGSSDTSTAQNGTESNKTNLSKFVAPIQSAFANSAMLATQKTGDPTGAATAARNSGDLYGNQAAAEQKNAQANTQIASRDYRNEADKNAVAGAAIRSAQKMDAFTAATDLGTAAIQREIGSPDYNTMMNRQDTQRQQGVQNQRAMYNAKQEQAAAYGDATADEYVAADRARRNRITFAVSSGLYGQGDTEPQNSDATTSDTTTSDTSDTNTNTITNTNTNTNTNTITIDGTAYDGTDIQNGINAYHGSVTRRMDENGEEAQNTPAYNASGRESKAIQLSNYLHSKFGDNSTEADRYIQDLRKQMTGKENMESKEDFKALATGNVPVKFTEELSNNMNR